MKQTLPSKGKLKTEDEKELEEALYYSVFGYSTCRKAYPLVRVILPGQTEEFIRKNKYTNEAKACLDIRTY